MKVSAQKHKTPHQKEHRSAFMITTALFVWGTFFITHTVQYSTVNKQQLPEFERGAAFIFIYQVFNQKARVKFNYFFFSNTTLPDVNIDGVYAIVLESNQNISRMQYRVERQNATVSHSRNHTYWSCNRWKTCKYILRKKLTKQKSISTLRATLQNHSSHQQHLLEPLDKDAP